MEVEAQNVSNERGMPSFDDFAKEARQISEEVQSPPMQQQEFIPQQEDEQPEQLEVSNETSLPLLLVKQWLSIKGHF